MDTPTRGLSPESAVAPADPSVAVASAPASSLPKSQDTQFSERVKAVASPLELKKLMAELNAPVRTPPPPAPSDGNEPSVAPVEAPPAEPEGEPTPEPVAEPQVEEPLAETDSDPQDTEGTTPEIPTAKKFRLTLPEDDKVGRLASSYMQRNRDWTLKQAMDAAEKQLGVKPEAVEPKQAEQAPVKSDLPGTIDEVDRAIDVMESERLKAASNLQMEDVVKLDANIRKLERQRLNLEREGERQQAAKAVEYDTQFNAAHAKASELYADAASPDSAFGKRMKEIDDALKDTEDPRFFAPDKPLKIAQMVAAELNIAPRKKGAPVAPVKTAPPPAPAPKKNVLPGGGSSTVKPVTSQKSEMLAEAEAIKTPLDLRNFRRKYGLPE